LLPRILVDDEDEELEPRDPQPEPIQAPSPLFATIAATSAGRESSRRRARARRIRNSL
jgi:hypothetical protein